MTHRELLRLVRTPGGVLVEALVSAGTRWVEAVKADIIWQLELDEERDPGGESVWRVLGTKRDSDDGFLYLIAAEEER